MDGPLRLDVPNLLPQFRLSEGLHAIPERDLGSPESCRRHGCRRRSVLNDAIGAHEIPPSTPSRIEEGAKDPVSVFIPPDGEVSAGNPGTLRLRLRPIGRSVQVLDHQSCNEGIIRSEGLVRGIRYVMRRDEKPVWILSIRSVLRKRHRLRLADGATWTFDTPFYRWQHFRASDARAQFLVVMKGEDEVGPIRTRER